MGGEVKDEYSGLGEEDDSSLIALYLVMNQAVIPPL